MLDKEKLIQDKASLETLLRKAQSDLRDMQVQMGQWQGAIAYINDNLSEEEEKK